ncbi:hypothetical protein LguiA_011142 [Lonicera macranthoides]
MSTPGFKYFVTFVDDYSRVSWLYLMKSCSELFAHFFAFCAEIKTKFNVSVHILRSDNAKEYLSTSFQNYMIQNGILHQTSCVDIPSQNGVAEQKNQHLLETARALLFQMNAPKSFWADTVSTVCFLINRMPSSVLHGEIPYSVLFSHKALFSIEPQIFGSTCFVRDVRPNVTKLDPKSLKCIFLGYSRLQKGYQCYYPSFTKYLVSSDVTFLENTPYSLPSTSDNQEEDDNWLIYTILSSKPVAEPASVKPLIHHVYTRRRPALDSCPTPTPSSLDPASSDDLPIALRKGKRQCTYHVSSCVSYNHLSHPPVHLLRLLIQYLFLKRFMKPYFILVGIIQ